MPAPLPLQPGNWAPLNEHLALLVASDDEKARWVGTALQRKLQQGASSLGIAFLGDSKGNGVPSAGVSGDWPYEFGVLLAAANQGWTVRHYLFNDATQDYAPPTTLQVGTGGERKVSFVTASSHTRKLPNTNIVRSSVDLDVAVRVAPTTWAPTTADVYASNYGGAGSRGWVLGAVGGGSRRFQLIWTADGTTNITATPTGSISFADGAAGWIRFVFQSNVGGNYNVLFYTSSDGVTWTQFGTTIVGVGTSTVFQPVAYPYEIGGRGTNGLVFNGDFYEIRIRDGVAGPLIAPCFPDAWQPIDSSAPSPTGSPTLALMCGCVSGQGIAYLSDSTRIKKLLAPYSLGPVLAITQTNDVLISPKDLIANWASWIAAIKTQAPQSTPIVVTQNPQYSPAANLEQYNYIRGLLFDIANQLSTPVIDAWQAFLDTGNPVAYVNVDGVHASVATGVTNRTGAQLWADYAYRALLGSTSR